MKKIRYYLTILLMFAVLPMTAEAASWKGIKAKVESVSEKAGAKWDHFKETFGEDAKEAWDGFVDVTRPLRRKFEAKAKPEWERFMARIKSYKIALIKKTGMSLVNPEDVPSGIGMISAVEVAGEVWISDLQGNSMMLTEGHVFTGAHTIATVGESNCVLVMSNGVVILTGENTMLSFEKYSQEAFSSTEGVFNRLGQEPSISDTIVKVDQGNVWIDSRGLLEGSAFSVTSDAGAATKVNGGCSTQIVKNDKYMLLANFENGCDSLTFIVSEKAPQNTDL